MNWKFKFVLILFFVFFINGYQSVSQWTTASSGSPAANNHYYDVYSAAAGSLSSFLITISQKAPPANCPKCVWYLGTITTQEEYSFVRTNFSIANLYTAAYRYDDSFNEFKYLSGPEVNQTLYNIIKGQQTLCAPFNFVTGHPYEGSNYISYDVGGALSSQSWGGSTRTYLIEAHEIEPYLPPIETVGGPVEIKYLDNYVISDITVTVQPLGLDANPVNIISRDSQYKKIVIDMPAMTGSGVNVINIYDGYQNFTIPYWRYKSPYIEAIYPNTSYISLLTISGENFGIDPSVISVKTGASSNVCKYVKIIEDHKAISCEVSQIMNSDTVLLPVRIKVGNSYEVISYRMGIYDRTNIKMNKFMYAIGTTYSVSLSNVNSFWRNLYTMDGNIGYQGVFSNSVEYLMVRAVVPELTLGYFTSLRYNVTSDTVYIDTAGAYRNGLTVVNTANTCLTGLYCFGLAYTGSTSGTSYTTYYSAGYYRTVGLTIDATATSWVQYGGIPVIPPQNLTIDQAGGLILVKATSGTVGFKYTKRGYKINDVVMNYPVQVLANNTLGLTVPPGTALTFNLTIMIEDFVFSGFNVNFTDPSIVSVAPVSTQGGLVTVYGYSFGIDPSVISITIDDIICENPSILINYTAITCNVQPGVGANKLMNIKIADFEQNTTFSYLPPTIQKIEQNDLSLVITGISFGNYDNTPTVWVPYNYTPEMTNSDPQILTFDVPIYAQNGKITVGVGGQNGTYSWVYQPYITSVSNLTSTEGNIISIAGKFLTQYRTDGSQTSSLIMIGGRQCTGPHFSYDVNGTYLTCFAPVGSGATNDFYISIDGKYSNILEVAYPAPTISSFIQVNSTITIIGSNFGPDISRAKVEVNGNLFNPTSLLLNPSRIVASIPTSTKNGQIRVKIDGQSSNFLNITFTPSISSISSAGILGGAVSIKGLFFNTLNYLGENVSYGITIGGVECSDLRIPSNILMVCTVQAGTGIKEFIFNLDSFTITKDYSYISPAISTIRVVNYQIEVNGTNIGGDPGLVGLNVYTGVYYNLESIEPASISANNWTSSILFDIPLLMFNSYVYLTVDGLDSNQIFLRLPVNITEVISDIPTTGGLITINGNFFSTVYGGTNQTLTTYVRVGSYYCGSPKYVNFTQIICTAPANTGYQNTVIYKDTYTSNTLITHYLPPVLDSAVINSVKSTQIDFIGSNFGTLSGYAYVRFSSLTQSFISSSYNQGKASAVIHPYAKNGNVSIVVNTQESNSLNLTLIPSIATTTSVDYTGGVLTISGNFLNTQRQDGSSTGAMVTFPGDVECTDVQQIDNDPVNVRTQITCNAPPGNGIDITLTVTIDGINCTTLFTYGSPVLTDISVNSTNFIVLTGSHFGVDSTSIQVELGTTNITILPFLTIIDSQITLQAPNSIHNDYIKVTRKTSGKSSESLLLQLYPVLTSVTASSTEGTSVTIIGKWLNPTKQLDLASKVLVYFDRNGGKVTYMNQNNNTIMLVTAPNGVGTNINLNVSIEGLSAQISTFNYLPPKITSTSQSGTTLNLLGINFGIMYAMVTVNPEYIISSVSHNMTAITLPTEATSGPFYLTVGGQLSNTYQVKITPVISSIFPAPPSGGNLTITGKYLNSIRGDSTPTTVSITVNGTDCPIVSFGYNTQIVCTVGTGNYKNVPLVLTIDEMPTTKSYTALGPVLESMIQSTLFEVPALITIGGQNFYDPMAVFINNVSCDDAVALSTTVATCYFNANIQPSLSALPVTIYSVNLFSTANIFRYDDLPCPNKCSEKGVCRNGICSCNVGFGGADCHATVNLTIPIPSTTDYGGSVQVDDDIFSAKILMLREIDANGVTKSIVPMDTLKWQIESSTSTGSYNLVVSKGLENPDDWFIRVSTYSLLYGQIFEFGGEKVSADSHSFKQSVEINGWKFASPYNTLQVIYSAETQSIVVDNCYAYYSSLKNYLSPYGDNDILAFDFENPIAVFTSRFTTRLVRDGVIEPLDVHPVTQDDPVWDPVDGILQSMIAIDIPSFTNSSVFDPTFSGYRKKVTVPCPTSSTIAPVTTSQTTDSTTASTSASQTASQTTSQTSQTTSQTTDSATVSTSATQTTGTSSQTSSSIATTSQTSSTGSTGSTRSCPYNNLGVCSGNGLCQNDKCYCYGSYTGQMCDSEPDLIPPPENPDPSKPGVNSTKDGISFDIQVVSIRELDYMGTEIMREIPLSNWNLTEIEDPNKLSYLYHHDLFDGAASIDVKIDYFYFDTVVQFAGSNSTKSKGTIKYSLNVTDWPFLKSIYQLQVVFKASIESSSQTSSDCSAKEITYGESSNDVRSINLQVNNQTFSSQFTNTAVIDDKVETINNIVLQNVEADTNSKTNTYIGMTSRSFSKTLSIDPDFSLLLTHVPAQEKTNSICGNDITSAKSKLKGSQIAGIVIGCFCFLVFIVAITIYIIRKKRIENRFNKNLETKLKSIN